MKSKYNFFQTWLIIIILVNFYEIFIIKIHETMVKYYLTFLLLFYFIFIFNIL